MRGVMLMCGGGLRFALDAQLIEAIGGAIERFGRFLDRFGCLVGGVGCLLCGDQGFGGSIFGARGGFLRVRCGRFGILGLLLLIRCEAARNRDYKNQN